MKIFLISFHFRNIHIILDLKTGYMEMGIKLGL